MPGLETTELSLDHWIGLDAYSSPIDMDIHMVSDCQNVDFSNDGVIEKRRGFYLPSNSTFSGTIYGIFAFESQQGFSTLSDNTRLLIVNGTMLDVIKNVGMGSETKELSVTVSGALTYFASSNNGVCYFSNENGGVEPSMLYYDAGWKFQSAVLTAPTIAASMASGGTGSLSGDYKIRYTYEDIFGNETNGSPAPTAITLSGTCVGTTWTGKTLLSSVTPSTDVSVKVINIYILPPQSSLYQWSQTTGNTSATFTISTTDATIQQGGNIPTDNFPIGKAKYITIFNDMLVTAGDPSLADLVYVSNVGFHREFGSESYDRVTSQDSQPIRGFGKSYNELVIGKKASLYRASGSDPESFAAAPYNPEYGVLGQPSMTFYNQRLAFFANDGIYSDNALVPDESSKQIRNLMRSLNPANLMCSPPQQVACTDKYFKRILWAVREGTTNGPNDAIYVWNYERNSWSRWTGVACTCLARVRGLVTSLGTVLSSEYEYVMGGDTSGHLFYVTPPNMIAYNYDFVGSQKEIDAYFTTPWINIPKALGIPNWDKVRTELQKFEIYAGGEPVLNTTASVTLTINLWTNFDAATIMGTFTTTHNSSAWPSVTIQPKTISLRDASNPQGSYEWFKLKVRNADQCHFKVYKIIFMFKLRPLVDK